MSDPNNFMAHPEDDELDNLRAENTRLNEELTATDTAWQNAELRASALEKRIEASPEVWMARSDTSDDHWLFPSEPTLEEGEWQWEDGNQLYLGAFDSFLNPGEPCKVRIVREVG